MIKFEKPNKVQFAQMIMLSVYIIVAWVYLGLLRPEKFYLVILYTFFLDFAFNLLPHRRTTDGKIKFPITGFVAGCAISLLIESPDMSIYFLAGTIAVVSKSLIRVNKKHVFNPANFAVVSTIILTAAGATVNIAQWSGAWWLLFLMIGCGAIVSFMAGRIHISLSYLFSFFVFALIYSYLKGLPFTFLPGSLLGISTILFAFHMVTDPATSPPEPKEQMKTGLFIAFVHIILYANSILYAQLIAALIVVSLVTFLKGFKPEKVPLDLR